MRTLGDVLDTYRAWRADAARALPLVGLRLRAGDPPGPPAPLETLLVPGGRLVVVGPPGSGRTTLATALACRAGGALMVLVEAARLLTTDPFEAAEADLRAAVGPVRAAGLAEALRAAGEDVWLLVDGLDEAPETARPVVARLAEGEAGVVAFDSGACFADRRFGRFEEARIEPLLPAEQAALLAAHLGEEAAPLLAHVRASTGLHPLARRPGTLLALAEAAAEPRPTRPMGVYDRVLTGRLAGLPAPTEARFALGHLALALVSLGPPPWPRELVVGVLTALAAGRRVPRQAAGHGALHAGAGERIQAALVANRAPAGRLFLQRVAVATGVMVEGVAGFRFESSGLESTLAGGVLAGRPEAEVAEAARIVDHATTTSAAWLDAFARYAEGMDDPVASLYRLGTPGLVQNVAVRVGGARPADALGAVVVGPGWGTAEQYRWLAEAWRDDPAALATLLDWVGSGADLEVCARVHAALVAIGQAEDDAAFFERIGLPMHTAPKLARVPIPAGSFRRGRSSIEVSAFELGVTAVTQAQFAAFDPTQPQGLDTSAPVGSVSWYVAWLFCRWVGGRLPTAAEWEYACRAGSAGAWCFGDDPRQLDDYAWTWLPGLRPRVGLPPVGQRRPNAWGLHDMHGGVWEWCGDWWRWTAGLDRRDPRGPVDGRERTQAGGSAYSPPNESRCDSIRGMQPFVRPVDGGFRVAWDAC
ncbi:MAG: SUMF1/EgtB/PvdO family nonheme iron enzyme [Myxococcales bacterium]|nr:SUMF1/EgtB/PvdO family nonheme iron enzyme [Myxococcales bacterium]